MKPEKAFVFAQLLWRESILFRHQRYAFVLGLTLLFVVLATSFVLGHPMYTKLLQPKSNDWLDVIIWINWPFYAALILPFQTCIVAYGTTEEESKWRGWYTLLTLPAPKYMIPYSKLIFILIVNVLAILAFSVLICIQIISLSIVNDNWSINTIFTQARFYLVPVYCWLFSVPLQIFFFIQSISKQGIGYGLIVASIMSISNNLFYYISIGKYTPWHFAAHQSLQFSKSSSIEWWSAIYAFGWTILLLYLLHLTFAKKEF